MLFKRNLFIISKLPIVKTRSWSSKSINAFCNLFDLSRGEFDSYRKETNIPSLEVEHLNEISNLRERINIPVQEWLLFPSLLKENARHLEECYLQLKEGGFERIDARILAKRLVQKSIRLLKAGGYLSAHVSVTESFLKHLNHKLSIENLSEESTFHFVYRTVLTHCLMSRFNTTQSVIEKFFRMYPIVKIKSFQTHLENFQLADKLNFPTDDIFQCGFLLSTHPKNTYRLLREVPTLAGMDIHEAIRLKPRLLRIPSKKIKEIYRCLREANIADDVIQHHLSIFFLSPNTVALRIKDARSIPEFNFFINDPNFLRLIINFGETRSRIAYLKEMKIKCTSLSVLCYKPEQFIAFLQQGLNMHRHEEVTKFIQQLLGSHSRRIGVNLKKHVHHRCVNLSRIEDNYEYLRELNFSREAIINAIPVLLYSRGKVKAAYESARDYLKGDGTEIEHLNLILYFMEREHHFTGNGIWNHTENA
ncbi:transcription termination factor 5, mitochondrial-like isoform X2 [Photinus pyralis]|uniref:transcription termination factor 5, mitochondrial-like isoform X2 n=1 Tax=Photinus pyralis TaxID=7054 RepID=UPI0012670C06|nr:transcription termination factor 5, mitochondrial-like isoform X2 [Photinus pyralis]XP_031346003.1 transcription termination factor 5, mitochondrial-like isoform X2 [Photinus pyralis]